MRVFQNIGSFLSSFRISALLAIAILVISLLPGNRIPDSSFFDIPFMDKYIHFGMYFSFSLAVLWEMRCDVKCLRIYTLFVLFSGLASLCIEYVQGLVIEGRAADWTDLLANISGLITGCLLYQLFRRRRIRS